MTLPIQVASLNQSHGNVTLLRDVGWKRSKPEIRIGEASEDTATSMETHEIDSPKETDHTSINPQKEKEDQKGTSSGTFTSIDHQTSDYTATSVAGRTTNTKPENGGEDRPSAVVTTTANGDVEDDEWDKDENELNVTRTTSGESSSRRTEVGMIEKKASTRRSDQNSDELGSSAAMTTTLSSSATLANTTLDNPRRESSSSEPQKDISSTSLTLQARTSPPVTTPSDQREVSSTSKVTSSEPKEVGGVGSSDSWASLSSRTSIEPRKEDDYSTSSRIERSESRSSATVTTSKYPQEAESTAPEMPPKARRVDEITLTTTKQNTASTSTAVELSKTEKTSRTSRTTPSETWKDDDISAFATVTTSTQGTSTATRMDELERKLDEENSAPSTVFGRFVTSTTSDDLQMNEASPSTPHQENDDMLKAENMSASTTPNRHLEGDELNSTIPTVTDSSVTASETSTKPQKGDELGSSSTMAPILRSTSSTVLLKADATTSAMSRATTTTELQKDNVLLQSSTSTVVAPSSSTGTMTSTIPQKPGGNSSATWTFPSRSMENETTTGYDSATTSAIVET